MVKQLTKGKEWLNNAYWSAVGMATATMLTMQPVLATATGTGTIWARFSTILKDVYGQIVAISKLKDPTLMETYRKGLRWRVEQEKQKAYVVGYRKGYRHAINGVPSATEDHGNAFTDVFFDLPGHNHPVSFLEPSEEAYGAMYFAGIHEVKQLLDADERKLLTEYRLGQNEINEIVSLLKKKGYSCTLTKSRNDISISYWPDNLLIAGLTETSAYHLLCYAPVDLRESFEFVRLIALSIEDEEILRL